MSKHTQTFKSFKDMAEAMRPMLRAQGHSIPKQKNTFCPHTAISASFCVHDVRVKRKKLAITREDDRGNRRTINLSQNTVQKYAKAAPGFRIEFIGRNVMTKAVIGLGVR